MKPSPLTITLEPRVNETDMQGHISNTAVPAWYEIGRSKILQECRKIPGIDQMFMAVRLEIDFLAEIFYGADVVMRSHIERFGNSSIGFYHELWQNDRQCGRCRGTMVYVDVKTSRPIRVPQAARDALSRYHIEPDPTTQQSQGSA